MLTLWTQAKDLINQVTKNPTGAILFGSRASGQYRANSDVDLAVISESPSAELYSKFSVDNHFLPAQIDFASKETWITRASTTSWMHALAQGLGSTEEAAEIVSFARENLSRARAHKKEELLQLDLNFEFTRFSATTLSFLSKNRNWEGSLFGHCLRSEFLQEAFLSVEAVRCKQTGVLNDAVADVFLHIKKLGGCRFLNPKIDGLPSWWTDLSPLLSGQKLVAQISKEYETLTGKVLPLSPSQIEPTCFALEQK